MTRLPAGFKASGIACGLKKKGPDLALWLCDRTATAAALFTTNRFRAAPVCLSAAHLIRTGGRARAIVINSGCANAATGRRGLAAARRTAFEVARQAGVAPETVLLASTGVIGEHLPVARLVAGLPAAIAGLGAGGLERASRAIMTTDTRPKTAEASFRWRGRTVRIAGCAKGAGMVHPRMATMLAVLLTDAAISPGLLRRALGEASRHSFESISIDGDTSTNDSVFLLASGASGVRIRKKEGSWARFVHSLGLVAGSLARQIVADGEGARRTLEIEVTGARDRDLADRVARAIACSPLVRTALAGGDANWGRILAAAGAAGVPFDPAGVSVSIGGVTVARRGAAVRYDRRRVDRLFRRPGVKVRVGLGRSAGRARMLTCDLTSGYVRINADYRS